MGPLLSPELASQLPPYLLFMVILLQAIITYLLKGQKTAIREQRDSNLCPAHSGLVERLDNIKEILEKQEKREDTKRLDSIEESVNTMLTLMTVNERSKHCVRESEEAIEP